MGAKRTFLTPAAASFGALGFLCSTLAAITLASSGSAESDFDEPLKESYPVTTMTFVLSTGKDGIARCRCIDGHWDPADELRECEPGQGVDGVEVPEVTASWKALKEDVERARREEQQKATYSELTPER